MARAQQAHTTLPQIFAATDLDHSQALDVREFIVVLAILHILHGVSSLRTPGMRRLLEGWLPTRSTRGPAGLLHVNACCVHVRLRVQGPNSDEASMDPDILRTFNTVSCGLLPFDSWPMGRAPLVCALLGLTAARPPPPNLGRR